MTDVELKNAIIASVPGQRRAELVKELLKRYEESGR